MSEDWKTKYRVGLVRKCARCKIEKGKEEMNMNSSYCKECRNAYHRERYAILMDQPKKAFEMKLKMSEKNRENYQKRKANTAYKRTLPTV